MINSYAAVDYQIEGVSGEYKNNINAYLKALDEPKNLKDENFLAEVSSSTISALTVFGYYQPSIDIRVTGSTPDHTIALTIDLGPATYIVESKIKISGEGKDSDYFTQQLDSFLLNKDDILTHTNYETAKGSLKSIARRYGYFDARFIESKVEVQAKNSRATVTILFDTGPRYLFGDLDFTSELAAKQFVISLKKFKTGDPFDAQLLTEFSNDLSETGYFKSISILPDLDETEEVIVPLKVFALMRPQDSFNAGFGYSTDEGIRGKFRWTRPWVNEYGHSIEGNLVASIPKQEASLTYKIPLEDPLYNYFSIQGGYKMLDQNDTDTTQYLLGANRHWRLDNDWYQTLFTRYDHEQGTQGQQEFNNQLIIPGISYSRSRSRGGINVTWGDKLMGSLEVSNEVWFSSDDLIKLYGQAKIIRTYSGHQFVASTELGAIRTDSIYNVPSSMRFFTGGDQTIRGFDYESIAPEDSDGYLVGGKYLTVASLEYRYPVIDDWKLALFLDAGTATSDFSEDLSSSVGTGDVWASPVGPIRLYVARPITNQINSFAIHFMIGPEL